MAFDTVISWFPKLKCNDVEKTLTLQPLLLGKERKCTQKSKENRKKNKEIARKKQGLEGQGNQSRFLERVCDEALFSEKKGFSVKGVFSEKGGGDSVNWGFGKGFYRKGSSVKRSGRFSEPPDSEN